MESSIHHQELCRLNDIDFNVVDEEQHFLLFQNLSQPYFTLILCCAEIVCASSPGHPVHVRNFMPVLNGRKCFLRLCNVCGPRISCTASVYSVLPQCIRPLPHGTAFGDFEQDRQQLPAFAFQCAPLPRTTFAFPTA